MQDAYLPGFACVPRKKFTVGGLQSGEIQILSASRPMAQRAFLFVRRDGVHAIIGVKITADGRILEVLGVTLVDGTESFRDLARAATAAADAP